MQFTALSYVIVRDFENLTSDLLNMQQDGMFMTLLYHKVESLNKFSSHIGISNSRVSKYIS